MHRVFTPSSAPSTDSLPELVNWLLQELRAVGIVTQGLAGQQVEELNAAPVKPRTGMVVLADGTLWNPGSGRGYYGYDAVTASWRFLG